MRDEGRVIRDPARVQLLFSILLRVLGGEAVFLLGVLRVLGGEALPVPLRVLRGEASVFQP